MRTALYRISGLCLLLAAGAARADEFPPGPMHDFVAKTCTQCHPATQVTAQRMTKAAWHDKVDQMIANGAIVSDAQFDKVVDYLATNFPDKK